ncbi:substrate-binding domain-containing protein [Donghicola sp. XS_ASV15]|uniref:substrate-binding domain-containing protein n=1 Tax=Donghicola sp. XS_ASV15 TaxID=3241295 RepID=UPI003512CBCF
MLSYPLEAMILRSGSLSADISEACGKLGIPVIASGRILEADGVDNVCCRNREGIAKGVEVLLAKGRRNFGFIGGPSTFAASADRRAGVVGALRTAGLTLMAEETGGFTVQSGYDAALRLQQLDRLDALVCANDAMAIGALSALREQGHLVPKDISVIGFDDIEMARWPSIQLTTLRNPIDALVEAVLDLLERRAAHPAKDPEMIWLDAEVILRATH